MSGIINFIMAFSGAVDPRCDLYQEMVIGKEYYIYNNEYPGYYHQAAACRWTAQAPQGAQIILSCEDIFLPSSPNCISDRLMISTSGDPYFRDARYYCGQQSLTIASNENAMTIGFYAPYNTYGGRFSCALTAMQVAPPPTPTAGPNTCDCGWKQDKRIVGGHNTGINEYPSMAVIIDKETGEAFCGASIISEFYALTAAHCLINKVPENLGLIVGDYDLSTGDDTAYAQLYKIQAFKQHPQYDMSTELNDIAILQTEKPMAFSLYVGPICLPFRYTLTDFYAQTVTALGWGLLDFSGNKSEILQEVDLSVIANDECKAAIPDPVTDQQICTYAPNKDTCLSDSGGPLIWVDATTRKWQLVGIISYGIGCATKKPAVNTRVTSYLSWIVSETRDAVYCIK